MIWTPHTTVATIVERNNQYLFVEEEIEGKIVLNQPAGHVEPLESLIDAASRETLEETGWQVLPQYLVGIYTYLAPNDVTYYRFCFAAKALQKQPDAVLDEGIIGPVWLTPEEVSERAYQWRSPLVMKCLEDAMMGKRFPLDILYEHPRN